MIHRYTACTKPHSKRCGYQGQEGQQKGGGFWDGVQRYVVATASGIGNVQIFATEITNQIALAQAVVLTAERAANTKEVEHVAAMQLKTGRWG